MTAADVDTARAAYAALCAEYGTDPVTEEQAILSVDRKCLPACALAVLDDPAAASVEYFAWLTEQTSQAQAEHDREIAAGHEWHEVTP